MSGFRVNPNGAELAICNAVLSGKIRSHRVDNYVGTLSLKTVIDGEGTWITPDGRYQVSPETCLTLNEGQSYQLEIDTPSPTQTFCVFFKPGFVEAVAESLGAKGSLGFYERLRLFPAGLSSPVRAVRALAREGAVNSLEADEAMIDLAAALIQAETAKRECRALELNKAAAREEVFRQLNRARDFALSSLASRLVLDDLAGAAAMSPFHFHRLHKQAFRETPHEFVTRARLSRAMRMLHAGIEVGDVSLRLGFESLPTFCRLFKARTGVTPGGFRKIG